MSADQAQIAVDSVAVQSGNLGNLASIKVWGEKPHQLAQLSLRNPRTVEVSIFPCYPLASDYFLVASASLDP